MIQFTEYAPKIAPNISSIVMSNGSVRTVDRGYNTDTYTTKLDYIGTIAEITDVYHHYRDNT